MSLAGCSGVDYVLGASNRLADAATLGPFNPPELVSALVDGDADANNPTFTADLRELFFTSGRAGGLGGQDIWVSTRASPSDPWGAPAVVAELNSPDLETSTGISADGLTIWFASDRPGGLGKIDVYRATRPDRSSPWTTPVNVPELSSTDDDMAHPAMGSPLLMLVATRSLTPPQWDLLLATRSDPAAPFSTPTPITELNSAASDDDPFLAADGQHFFFNSDRAAASDEDLYQATRDPTTGRFSEPEPMTDLNTVGSDERDPWASEDLRYLVFSSNRSGTYLTYETSR